MFILWRRYKRCDTCNSHNYKSNSQANTQPVYYPARSACHCTITRLASSTSLFLGRHQAID